MTADETFEKIGYRKVVENPEAIIYRMSEEFFGEKFEDDIIIFAIRSEIIFSQALDGRAIGLSIPKLHAINQKCKELGWLE